MAKRGRPPITNKAKNRVHSIVLNEKAEIVYRQICQERGTKWFNRYVCEHLLNDFTGGEKTYLLYVLKRKQAEIDKLYSESREIAKKINEIDLNKEIMESKKLIGKQNE